MKKIEIKKGNFMIVDDEDYIVLSRFKYQVSDDGTVIRAFRVDKKLVAIPAYKLIIHDESGKVPIYKNGNNLDLRKENIELVSRSIFMYKTYAKRTFENKTSRYRGVMKLKKGFNGKIWKGQITKNRERFHKYFRTENDAGVWYNEKAIELYGNKAYQNIIENHET